MPASDAELVGTRDIARRLGVSRQRVTQIVGRDASFPAPIGAVNGQAAFDWREVEKWARQAGRLPKQEEER